MSKAAAWLLNLGEHRAAVGVREQVHLMLDPAATELAGTPAHCRHVIFWNDRCVPVLDLGCWLDAVSVAAQTRRHLGIYAYQQSGGAAVEFGALWLTRPPQRIEVDDASAASLPREQPRWSRVAAACFTDAQGAVPILDLSRVFSALS